VKCGWHYITLVVYKHVGVVYLLFCKNKLSLRLARRKELASLETVLNSCLEWCRRVGRSPRFKVLGGTCYILKLSVEIWTFN
jgi:hypothetical protein